MTRQTFSSLTEKEQVSTIERWVADWEEERSSRPNSLDEFFNPNYSHLDRLCYIINFYREFPALIKTKAALILESLVLRFPYLSLVADDRLACIRMDKAELKVRPLRGRGFLPWPDYLVWQFICEGPGSTTSTYRMKQVTYNVNYLPMVDASLYSHVHRIEQETTTSDHVLFLCTLTLNRRKELLTTYYVATTATDMSGG